MARAYGYALFAVVNWALAPVIFKSLVGGLDFRSAVLFFLFFGGVSMFFCLVVKGDGRSIIDLNKNDIGLILVMGLANYLHYFCYTYSLSHIDASVVIVLAKLSPIFQVALAAIVLKEGIKGKVWLVFLFGFIGVAIVASNGQFAIIPDGAIFVAMLVGLFWALFIVLTKRAGLPFCVSVGWALFIGTVFMGLHLLVIQTLVLPYGTQWLWLAILGVFPTALAVVAMVKAMDIAQSVAKIAGFDYLTPALGVIFSWQLLQEEVSVYLVIGLIVILVSIYFGAKVGKKV